MRPLALLITLAETHPDMRVTDQGSDGFAFLMRQKHGPQLRVIVGCGLGWDHVSVSTSKRTPTYQEMKMVKTFIFEPDEWAIEYHPPPSSYISIHPNVLHLWRPHDLEIPKPPEFMV